MQFNFGAVLLAAGKSSRMGRQKMLLPWGGITVIGESIARWRGLGAGQIAPVCDAQNEEIRQELETRSVPKADMILNPHPETGMFGSIQCAAGWPGWHPDLTHWVISLGDQPHLRPETLQSLIQTARSQPDQIWQPARKGNPRHPVILPKRVFLDLNAAIGPTFKDFLRTQSHLISLSESDDSGLDFDLDTPADYERALRLYSA